MDQTDELYVVIYLEADSRLDLTESQVTKIFNDTDYIEDIEEVERCLKASARYMRLIAIYDEKVTSYHTEGRGDW